MWLQLEVTRNTKQGEDGGHLELKHPILLLYFLLAFHMIICCAFSKPPPLYTTTPHTNTNHRPNHTNPSPSSRSTISFAHPPPSPFPPFGPNRPGGPSAVMRTLRASAPVATRWICLMCCFIWMGEGGFDSERVVSCCCFQSNSGGGD